MSKLKPAPVLAELLREHSTSIDRIVESSRFSGLTGSADYPHWDHLANAAMPPMLTMREWWLAIKLQRVMSRRPLGLADQAGQSFTLGGADNFAEALHELDRTSAPGKGAVLERATVDANDALAESALRDEAIASAQLDGAHIEVPAAHELLRLQRKPHDAGERIVLNTYQALQRIREIRAQPLTLSILAELHQRLTAGTLARPDLPGRLRRDGDPVRADSLENQLLREPPPAAELPARLKTMLAFANQRAPAHFVHPLLRATALHFWVVYDMPFADGNGRLARALFFWSVLHSGYDIFEHLAPSAALRDVPAHYLRAFHYVETDENDLMYFASHIFDAIASARKRFEENAQRETLQSREAAELTSAHPEFNSRQRAVIAQALKEPRARWLLQEHARNHRLVRQTARNDFAPLVKRGWFEEAKVGRALAFFPVADLAQKIRP